MDKVLTIAILVTTLCSAPAYAGLNIIINPGVPVVPVINECEAQYNNIVANEQLQLQNCQNMYYGNPALQNACQNNVVNQTNVELYNNTNCRDYYLQYGVVFIPGREHEHREWHTHPEHFPHHDGGHREYHH